MFFEVFQDFNDTVVNNTARTGASAAFMPQLKPLYEVIMNANPFVPENFINATASTEFEVEITMKPTNPTPAQQLISVNGVPALFNRTSSGADVLTVVSTARTLLEDNLGLSIGIHGVFAVASVQVNKIDSKVPCGTNREGWNSTCLCLPGFYPNPIGGNDCIACPADHVKVLHGDYACTPRPLLSTSSPALTSGQADVQILAKSPLHWN